MGLYPCQLLQFALLSRSIPSLVSLYMVITSLHFGYPKRSRSFWFGTWLVPTLQNCACLQARGYGMSLDSTIVIRGLRKKVELRFSYLCWADQSDGGILD